MYFCNPTIVKNFITALKMALALMFLKGVASGNPLEAHIIMSRNLFPDHAFGNGPIQSIIILLKVSSKAACKRAWGIF